MTTESRQKVSQELFRDAITAIQEETVIATIAGIEKKLKEKYAKGKGKPIFVKVYCTACSQHFMIKGKNNKTDATSKQLCPHLIFKTWEVSHIE